MPLTLRCRRVWSSNLSTQLRRTLSLNTESLTMPAAVADPNRSLDSEQISPATIAHHIVVVVVVVFTLTDRASTIPSNIRGCQSGTWSQRGTKVNGSHHGDNPLLRPTGIQIATKSYATLQAMAPTNNKTVHQTSFTPYYREQPRSTRIVFAYPRPAFSATNRTNTFQPVLINNSKFIKATHRTKIRKIEIPRSMVVEALSC